MMSAARLVSTLASNKGLPCSVVMMVAISSRRWRIRSAALRMIL
jgi:hypothetical protein